MTEIKIKDLRGVGDVELKLDDSKRVFVFFGSNGVGKTRTLESIFLYFVKNLKGFHYSSSHIETSKLPEKALHLPFRELIFNGESLFLEKGINRFKPVDYESFFHRIKNLKVGHEAVAYLGAKFRSGTSPNNFDYYANNELGSFDHRFSTFCSTLSDAINLSELDSLGMNQNINQWFTERAKSVNPYQKEEDNRKVDIDTVLNALNILDNRIEKTLKIDGDGNVFLTVEGQERELSELSSGFISVVKIIQSIISAYSAFTNATDLLNVKGVVLIDEIESHLHIEWQTKIVPTLKNLFPNTTFYIATHSPLVLSQLGEGEAYLLKREKDGVVRSEKINSPNTRLLENVLQDAFDVDLNELKRENMEHIDQSKAKQKLLKLLNG